MPRHAEITLHPAASAPIIHRNLHGHFAEHLGRCIYEGIWVGDDSPMANVRGIRTDVARALKDLGIPVLRWPGGCFADEYHWRDGIGPRDRRPKTINTHWGGVIENNHFGTHEFMDLCQQIGADPYITGNVGSGTVQEMMDWVEYITGDAGTTIVNLRRQNGRDEPWKLPYFGVGNESWGCGGNMRPESYAEHFRRYATFVKEYAGNRIERIACGANGPDYDWTRALMTVPRWMMRGLSLHWYTLPTGSFKAKGSATGFDEDAWHSTFVQALRIDEIIARHAAIMDEHDPDRRVGLVVDEWGTWYDAEPGHNPSFLYQQNTLRDALVAAVHLNVFHRHAARVTMANLAQTVNVLQALVLTDADRMMLTPTYHVFEMYKRHQGAKLVPLHVETPDFESIPQVHASASSSSGVTFVSLVNLHPGEAVTVTLGSVSSRPHGRILTAASMDAHNTFSQPDTLKPAPFHDVSLKGDAAVFTLPPKSVVTLEM